jgi:hypothetical protein
MSECIKCLHYDKFTSDCKITKATVDESVSRVCGSFIEVVCSPEVQGKMREFDTGATRDVSEDKLSYVKGLSPIVLKRYLQYLNEHRIQADGNKRTFDNWKLGIPQEAYLDGLGRHFIDVWLLCHGYSAEDNHGPVNLESALCAVMFNSMGMLYELLKEKGK